MHPKEAALDGNKLYVARPHASSQVEDQKDETTDEQSAHSI